jgi:hypothetical protein
LPGKPQTPYTPVGAAIMVRAVSLGYPGDPYVVGAAARISGRTVWNLVTGKAPNHYSSTYAALERVLGYAPGSLRAAAEAEDPGLLETGPRAGLQRTLRDVFGAAGVSVDAMGPASAVLRSAAEKIRMIHAEDMELLTVAEIADAVAAEIGDDAFGQRLAARHALTARDRRAIQAHRAAPPGPGPVQYVHGEAPPEALEVAFRPATRA